MPPLSSRQAPLGPAPATGPAAGPDTAPAAAPERVAEAIHELNNLLTVVAGRASLLRSAVAQGDQPEIDAILDAVRGCQGILGPLREIASPRLPGDPRPQSSRGANGTGCGSPLPPARDDDPSSSSSAA